MSLLKAYLVPHPPIIMESIGGSDSKICSDTIDAMRKISEQISELKPDNIIIISPHAPLFRDAVAIISNNKMDGDFGRFGHPGISYTFLNNINLAKNIYMASEENNIPSVLIDEENYGYDFVLDHGIMVPLSFITEKYDAFRLVPLNYGLINRKDLVKFGNIIRSEIEKSGEKTVLIASGDLSHSLLDRGPYSFTPEGPEFDGKIVDAISASDLSSILDFDDDLVENAHQCGYNSLVILEGVLSGTNYISKLLSYEGPFGVGYAVAEFELNETAYGNIDPYVKLAKETIENYVKNGTVLKLPGDLPEEMIKNSAGVFVTIYKDGSLRGCIGTIGPVQDNIAMEIIHNGISSCSQDPRFYAVDESELPYLNVSVDVLMPSEAIDSVDDLDPAKYGVIVYSGRRRGLLLPNLEGIDTAQEQVDIALKKAGIHPTEQYKMERFEVVRHK